MSRIVTFAKRNKKEVKRFAKFMVVGVIGAVVDFGVLNILAHIFDVDLRIAGAISFFMAVSQNFLWNRFWTYPESKVHPFLSQYFQFFIINAMALVIRIPLLTVLPAPLMNVATSLLHVSARTAEVLANNGALAVSVAIAMFWNFFINRFVTYRHIKVGQ
jgi:putative flippase GtrA